MLPRLPAHQVDGIPRMLMVRLAQRNNFLILCLLAHAPPFDADGMVAGNPPAAFMAPILRHRARQLGDAGEMSGVLLHP